LNVTVQFYKAGWLQEEWAVADTDDNLAIERADRPSSQRKITKILAAARAEFFGNGFSASSIEAIAARAGVSKVTIYSWFKTKENLFAEMVKGECAHLSQNFVAEHLESKGVREVLIDTAENMLDFLTRDERVRFDRILAAEVSRDPRVGKYFLDNGPRALLQNLATLLGKRNGSGENAKLRPDSFSRNVCWSGQGTFGSVASLWRDNQSDSEPEARTRGACGRCMDVDPPEIEK
jgi:TetR/AcrR family transcriptional repressor of mexJK operon